MQNKKEINFRKSVRLRNYDYSFPGAYFITICTKGKKCFFGEIRDGQNFINAAGNSIIKWWKELPVKFKDISLDEYVLMPNHFHGILLFIRPIPCVGAGLRVRPKTDNAARGEHIGSPLKGSSAIQTNKKTTIALPKIIQWFKTMTTNEYIRGVKQNNWSPFDGKLWQRNYYDHVIRNEKSLDRIREYIYNNSLRWHLDKENPNSKGEDEFHHWLNSFKSPPGMIR
jgi:putative transposase